jgi:hypothetical protein
MPDVIGIIFRIAFFADPVADLEQRFFESSPRSCRV